MYILFYSSILSVVNCFCGTNVGWTHQMSVEDAYGKWYGVGYAQHNQDITNKPVEIGCVTLYINDATAEYNDDWLDWPVKQDNDDTNGSPYENRPWRQRGDYNQGTWPPRFRRKRDMYHERRLKVLWDQDGQTMLQTYVYSLDSPGLWTAEQWRPGEREMRSRGADTSMWYPEEPPRHPEVIRVLKLSPEDLIINHCTERGDGGVFSLVLRRYPQSITSQESYDSQKLMMSYGLSPPKRYKAICAACSTASSAVFLFVSILLLNLL